MSQQPKPENSGNTSCSSAGEEEKIPLAEVQELVQAVSRTAVTARYPQMNSWANQEATGLVATEFLEWLEATGRKICVATPHDGYQPILTPVGEFVSEFLGVDHAELQRERTQLLKETRERLAVSRLAAGELKGLQQAPGGCRTGRCPPRRTLGTLGAILVSPQTLKDLEAFNDRDPSNPTDGSSSQQEAIQETDHPPGATQGEA